MVERQDIDALLIGSLYGELSSAEEARLAAHLESHPADRAALAGLTRAREAVRESRILQHHYEPSQSIYALLVQEAARRAPKPREELSWLQRFMRSFVAHPAMAAAAMLVLIIGVAGTVYLKKGDQFAYQTKEPVHAGAPEPSSPTLADESSGLPSGDLQGRAAAGSGQNFEVGLRERDNNANVDTSTEQRVPPADRPTAGLASEPSRKRELAKDKAVPTRATLAPDEPATTAAPPPSAAPAPTTREAAKSSRRDGYLEVTTPDREPKDLDAPTKDRAKDGMDSGVDSVGASGAPATESRPSDAKSRATGTVAKGNAVPPSAPTVAPDSEKKDALKVDPELAWAKEQHGRVIAAVKAGSCKSAASIAVQISNRVPAYYTSNVENDRTLKQCMQYIADQRERDAERSQRAKSTQQRASDDAPAPAKAAPTTK
ncbi:MAG TPA: hypothetical protein VK427_13090 [Kofleriaceae bacterium]|nr:hypothetical protein [Kofleriaceae bacterium]